MTLAFRCAMLDADDDVKRRKPYDSSKFIGFLCRAGRRRHAWRDCPDDASARIRRDDVTSLSLSHRRPATARSRRSFTWDASSPRHRSRFCLIIRCLLICARSSELPHFVTTAAVSGEPLRFGVWHHCRHITARRCAVALMSRADASCRVGAITSI